jgi:hypothetical protein
MTQSIHWKDIFLVYKGFKKEKLCLEMKEFTFVDTDVVEVNI